MTGNAAGMVAGRVAAMGLGFLFWLLAARVAPSAQVGFAAAMVSAMMLCTQFAQLGVGSAFIKLAPEHRERPGLLLDAALTVTAAGSLLVAGMFLLVARRWLPELGQATREPWWVLAFLAMSVLGTAGIVLDQVNVALSRGFQVLTRTAAFGVLSLVPVAVLPLTGVRVDALLLFSFWVAAGAGALLVGLRQLSVAVPVPPGGRRPGDHPSHQARGYRYRPRWQRSVTRRLIAVGTANHLLTLCERVPGLVLPVVATELISPEANAVWYMVWMSAWVVFTAPISMGIALFAHSARQPQTAAGATVTAIRTSVLFAGGGAAVLALLADPLLGLLGPHYAEAGVTPLRILLVAVLPLAVVSAYYAQCRARGRLAEAIVAGSLAGVAGVVAPAMLGTHRGLTGMALAWVAVQVIAGGWAAARLWTAARRRA